MEAVKEPESGQPQREAESEAADAGFEDEDEDDGIIEVCIIICMILIVFTAVLKTNSKNLCASNALKFVRLVHDSTSGVRLVCYIQQV